MKNKEKYEEWVLTFACDEGGFGAYEKTGEMERCTEMHCTDCLFYGKKGDCRTNRRKWLDSEYIEKPVISKRDRAFLEYLDNDLKYIARDKNECLVAYECIGKKGTDECGLRGLSFGKMKSFFRLNVQFPMVKWSDSEPWLIEDLKKLEVVEEYE